MVERVREENQAPEENMVLKVYPGEVVLQGLQYVETFRNHDKMLNL